MSDTSLCYISASEAARRYRDGTLSPVEVTKAVIEQAERTEPSVNAFTFTHFDRALDRAAAAEKKFSAGKRCGPLEGIPLAVKDSSEIAGDPNSYGSIVEKDYVATQTSIVNERVLRAGAIVHARTATPEFSCAVYCHSKLWGVTRNPWNPSITPGGSSGGSGASLAAGSTVLATGSDIGGSIRVPAGCCGVVGYKPPYGRNPMDPPLNLDPYCHSGPMARSVADAILMQNVMSGPHPGDIATLPERMQVKAEPVSLKGWKIAYSLDLGFFEVDADVAANTRAAVEAFRDMGAEVEETEVPWDWSVIDAALDHLVHLFGTSLSPYLERHADDLTGYARAFAEAGQGAKPADFVAAMEKAAAMYEFFGPLMRRKRLFLCPTNAIPGVAADFDHSADTLTINGEQVNPFLGWVMTVPFNMLSRCPVLSVPSGRAVNGVPTGLQIVGRPFDDRSVLRAGLAYEASTGGWYGSEKQRPRF